MIAWSIRYTLFAALICNWLSADVCADSVYSAAVIATTNPTIYWDLEETTGNAANDLAPSDGNNSGSFFDAGATTLGTAANGVLGPQPADGFITMSPDIGLSPPLNNAIFGKHEGGNGVGHFSLSTVGAGISTSNYSMAAWFIGDEAFANNNISYVLARANSTIGTDLRDYGGVGGAGTAPNVDKVFVGDLDLGAFGGSVTAGEWHHMVVVRDDSLGAARLKVYLDGTLRTSIDTVWDGGAGDAFTAGSRPDNAAGDNCCGLEGRVDEVAVWNRSLDSSEVQLLYDLAFVPEPTSFSLVGLGALGLLRFRRRKV